MKKERSGARESDVFDGIFAAGRAESRADGFVGADARCDPGQWVDGRAERDCNLRVNAGDRVAESHYHGGDLQLFRRSGDDRRQRVGGDDHLQHGGFRRERARGADRALRGDDGNCHMGNGGVVLRNSHQREPRADCGSDGRGGCDTRQLFGRELGRVAESPVGTASLHRVGLRSGVRDVETGHLSVPGA